MKRYDEIVHFSLSNQLDGPTKSAREALSLMGDGGNKVTVLDSENLSTGMGHMIMNALRLF